MCNKQGFLLCIKSDRGLRTRNKTDSTLSKQMLGTLNYNLTLLHNLFNKLYDICGGWVVDEAVFK